ncbi:hypothetical protein NKG94_21430 [Micromonospora sp. M12]
MIGDKARLTFARDAAPLKGVPAAVKQAYGDELKQLRDLAKRVGATLAAERQRVEGCCPRSAPGRTRTGRRDFSNTRSRRPTDGGWCGDQHRRPPVDGGPAPTRQRRVDDRRPGGLGRSR